VRVLIATDSFPPNCGGSGWSTWELARGLRAAGHVIDVVQPRPGVRVEAEREYDGFTVAQFASPAPRVPVVRNYFKNEYLYPRLGAFLAARIRRGGYDLVHAQHVLTVPPAVLAGRQTGVPVIATVRDYWPICYWSTLIHDPAADSLCPVCSDAGMRACLRPRTALAGVAALPLVPYMRRNLALKRLALAGADAVIAVSSTIAADLEARAPELRGTRIEQIPNPFDLAAIRTTAAAAPAPQATPYAVYVGKLEPNKGADLLPDVAVRAALGMPLVIVGDGALREAIAREARDRGVALRITGWVPRDAVLAWLAHARLLVFPSRGPESLSRVLVEAAALGVPTAAMDTGGTRDIVRHEETGLLSSTAAGLAADAGRLARDAALRDRLGAAARTHADEHFEASAVVGRIADLYRDIISGRAA
jgi:glycosyltransferase involved in cell wall biosynthesis